MFTPKMGCRKREAISDRADFCTHQLNPPNLDLFTETAYCWSFVAHMRWFKKIACQVNGSLWINGCVYFNRDFTIQNPIASRFHCNTIVVKKVFNKKLYNIKSTKSIFLHPVHIEVRRIMNLIQCSVYSLCQLCQCLLVADPGG